MGSMLARSDIQKNRTAEWTETGLYPFLVSSICFSVLENKQQTVTERHRAVSFAEIICFFPIKTYKQNVVTVVLKYI